MDSKNTQSHETEYQLLVKSAMIQIFGKDGFSEIEDVMKSEPKRYRMKFTAKPLMEWLDKNKHVFQITPEQKHKNLLEYPFLDIMDSLKHDLLKYNIISIKNNDSTWVVEYFNLNSELEKFIGTDVEVMKYFNMDVADLYYISKVIIPKNNSKFKK